MSSNAEIAAAHDEGRRLWPGISISPEHFGEMIRDAGVTGDTIRLRAGDLYLACAAGHGDPAAMRVIEDQYIARLPARIRRLGSAADKVADVLQMVRERLFAGHAPRIRAYNGSGPLEQWIKVVAIRTAIDLHRSDLAIPRTEAAWVESFSPTPPDLSAIAMKAQYKREFETAIRELLTTLSPRDRAVLRLHLVQGVGIDKIAASYGVHRVTVARWVWTAGEHLLDGLRHHFQQKFGIVPHEFDSVARLTRSQLSIDLAELLN